MIYSTYLAACRQLDDPRCLKLYYQWVSAACSMIIARNHSETSQPLRVSEALVITGWNYACAGAWPLSRKDVIAENKMASLLQYFVLMAIIVSIECRKDVFKCSVCGKNLSNLKAERRKFRAVSDDLFACFGPLEEESPHEPGKKFLCGTCRRALADFKRTSKTFFHASKNAISQQSVTICVS